MIKPPQKIKKTFFKSLLDKFPLGVDPPLGFLIYQNSLIYIPKTIIIKNS